MTLRFTMSVTLPSPGSLNNATVARERPDHCSAQAHFDQKSATLMTICKRPGNTVLSRSADRREDGVRYGIGGHHGRSDTREWKCTGCTGASTATATHDRAEGGDCA